MWLRIANWLFGLISATRLWYLFSTHFLSRFSFRIMGFPEFPMERYWQVREAIEASEAEKPGGLYAFTSCNEYTASAKLIHFAEPGGLFTHAGWIDPNSIGGPLAIIHMISEGCVRWDLLSLLREVDHFAVLRFDLANAEDAAAVKRRIRAVYEHRIPYDFRQRIEALPLRSKKLALYCSEFVLWALRNIPCVRPDGVHYFPRPVEVSGRSAFTPDQVWKQCGRVLFLHRSASVPRRS